MAITSNFPIYNVNGPCCAACEWWTGMRGRGQFDTSVLSDRDFEGKCLAGQGSHKADGGCGNGKIWHCLTDDPSNPSSGVASSYSPWFEPKPGMPGYVDPATATATAEEIDNAPPLLDPRTFNTIAFYALAFIFSCWSIVFIAGCFRDNGFNINDLFFVIFFGGLFYMAYSSHREDVAEDAKEADKKKGPMPYQSAECLSVANKIQRIIDRHK